MKSGRLYLIPTPIASGPVDDTIPAGTLRVIARLRVFVVEELRTARRFLKSAGFPAPLDECRFFILNEHTVREDTGEFLKPVMEGMDAGLMSEAGVPCIADPGNNLVMRAHRLGIPVIPLSGPSSVILALAGSGLYGQHFTFYGYLPPGRKQRTDTLREITREIRQTLRPQVFIEAPYRNLQMLETILECCPDEMILSISCNLTGSEPYLYTASLKEWKGIDRTHLHKHPAVFILGTESPPRRN
ncbi:MAG: SAM-dependent methyltransferase [Bacteroidales bacterium]|nr:SAM-dependent methyltransferase [Bacteroidales bacterium]